MKLLVKDWLCIRAHSQIVQKKVIDSMSGSNGIETYHTRVWFLNAVFLCLSLLIRLSLFSERSWIN